MLYEALVAARHAAVAVNPVNLVLKRKAQVKGATGIYTETTTSITAQKVRLVKPTKGGFAPDEVRMAMPASYLNADWLVLFESSEANAQEGDTFTHPVTQGPCSLSGVEKRTIEGKVATITGLALEVR